MKLIPATVQDIPALYDLQLLAFESEAEMIGSRDVPALMESREHHREDFPNWITMKLVNDEGKIVGAIRYRPDGGIIDVGRLMVHPDYRRQGLAQRMLAEADGPVPTLPESCTPVQKAGSTSGCIPKWGTARSERSRRRADCPLSI